MKRLLLLVPVFLAGCTRPGDYPVNPNCVWNEEDHRPLNLTTFSDRRHLRLDAVTAEDVAIRWADQHYGHLPEYEERRDQCMMKLFEGVANQHAVNVTTVRQYSSHRDVAMDTLVFVTFGFVYAAVAYIFAGRIRRRFPPGEPGFWIMSVTMAAGVSLVAVMVGNLLSIVVESFVLNSVHLSYRMDRLPWRVHWVLLLVCAFAVFGLATLLRYRIRVPNKEAQGIS